MFFQTSVDFIKATAGAHPEIFSPCPFCNRTPPVLLIRRCHDGYGTVQIFCPCRPADIVKASGSSVLRTFDRAVDLWDKHFHTHLDGSPAAAGTPAALHSN